MAMTRAELALEYSKLIGKNVKLAEVKDLTKKDLIAELMRLQPGNVTTTQRDLESPGSKRQKIARAVVTPVFVQAAQPFVIAVDFPRVVPAVVKPTIQSISTLPVAQLPLTESSESDDDDTEPEAPVSPYPPFVGTVSTGHFPSPVSVEAQGNFDVLTPHIDNSRNPLLRRSSKRPSPVIDEPVRPPPEDHIHVNPPSPRRFGPWLLVLGIIVALVAVAAAGPRVRHLWRVFWIPKHCSDDVTSGCEPCPVRGHCAAGMLVHCDEPFIVDYGDCIRDEETIGMLVNAAVKLIAENKGNCNCRRMIMAFPLVQFFAPLEKCEVTMLDSAVTATLDDMFPQQSTNIKLKDFVMETLKSVNGVTFNQDGYAYNYSVSASLSCWFLELVFENLAVFAAVTILSIGLLTLSIRRKRSSKLRGQEDLVMTEVLDRLKGENRDFVASRLKTEISHGRCIQPGDDYDRIWKRVSDRISKNSMIIVTEMPDDSGTKRLLWRWRAGDIMISRM